MALVSFTAFYSAAQTIAVHVGGREGGNGLESGRRRARATPATGLKPPTEAGRRAACGCVTAERRHGLIASNALKPERAASETRWCQ